MAPKDIIRLLSIIAILTFQTKGQQNLDDLEHPPISEDIREIHNITLKEYSISKEQKGFRYFTVSDLRLPDKKIQQDLVIEVIQEGDMFSDPDIYVSFVSLAISLFIKDSRTTRQVALFSLMQVLWQRYLCHKSSRVVINKSSSHWNQLRIFMQLQNPG